MKKMASNIKINSHTVWRKELMDERIRDFYKNKKVLLTGHTGFKGAWLTRVLLKFGAVVTGYSLNPSSKVNLFDISNVEYHPNMTSIIGDIRDIEHLKQVFKNFKPEIVIHLAAQPIVRDSYQFPLTTYSTNIMGTVNILECIRTTSGVRSFVNVTTDKVYKNIEKRNQGYKENDPLDGFDPYSNSKSCSELVTHSYKNSFFSDGEVRISTARAGNVIGGGDFANDRIIPDAIRAMKKAYEEDKHEGIIPVRNPHSIRPYQHVLEPLFAYLMIAMRQYEDQQYAGYYNVGPDDCDCVNTGKLVELFCNKWNQQSINEDFLPYALWVTKEEKNSPHEASYLKLDCSKLKIIFGWKPVWNIEKAIEETVKFSKIWLYDGNIETEMNREIEAYIRKAISEGNGYQILP